MRFTGNDYIPQSHGNNNEQYFNPALDDLVPLSRACVMSDTDDIISPKMHMGSHSNPIPSQPFGPLDEQGLQVDLANFFDEYLSMMCAH